MSPAGSGPAKFWTVAVWKSLLIYVASPLVAAVMIIGIFFPYLILLIALIVGVVVTARPSK